MKIKIVVLDRDVDFMNRLARAFQNRYEDRISLSMFSAEETMYESLSYTGADLIITDRKIEKDRIRSTGQTVIGRFCEASDVSEIDGVPAICKYQSVENIYNSILEIYAEHSENVILKKEESDVQILFFTSVQGGAGTSSAAAAYALRRAKEGKRVFYLNLEKFGDTDIYFSGDGRMSCSDVIYALKSRNGNLSLRLESIIRTDQSGVDFFHTCKNAYDMFELQDEEIETLITTIPHVKKYDEIIIDLSGDLSERMIRLMTERADKIIYVSDGSVTGNGKFEKFCEVVHVMEQRNDWRILGKTVLLYNRFSSRTGEQLTKTAVPVLGGIHRYEGMSVADLIQEIAKSDAVTRI